ncbi:hypothetical protein ACLKA7_000224 [Drosophila subpalustris]
MAGLGNLEQFDLAQPHKWTSYWKRFTLFLLANDVKEEERKKAAFLTLAGVPLQADGAASVVVYSRVCHTCSATSTTYPICDQRVALHAAHPGIVKIKALARSYAWWPNIDAEIEAVVKSCCACQEIRNEPQKTPTHHWESAKRPRSRLHFFLVVDSYSKWLEVAVISSTSVYGAVKFLRQLFATHGLPDELVSDNGTAFTSEEFKMSLCSISPGYQRPS